MVDPCRSPACDAQRMEALARLAAAVAHDYNNVLSVIFGYTELLLDDARDEPTRESLREVVGAVERAMALSRELLAFGLRQATLSASVPVADTLRRLEPALAAALGPAVRLVLDLPADVGAVVADAGLLEQALLDLAAFVATSGATTARLSARQEGGHVHLALADDGAALAKEAVSRLFEPFYTSKVAGRGAGLGLARVYASFGQMGGSVTVASGPGGTRFELVLVSGSS